MIQLAVNIDHVATVRNARGGIHPDPILAAKQAIEAGAAGIVCHLREDRRHIKDADVFSLRNDLQTKLDLEMAAEEEIIRIAEVVKPELVTIVPEKRKELTTEGGLNIAADPSRYAELVKRMHDAGIEISFFIEPDAKQIETAHKIGADIIELHTGTYADAFGAKSEEALSLLIKSGAIAQNLGLKVTAGHGLDYHNITPIKSIPGLVEVSIGHALISRAIFVGIQQAVKEMKLLLQ
ncbi:MAG: pyridoxine 5'-phosphate synthase [Candidatus Kapaibacteriota bacterium]|jgi:pyridoxine 5-phosphate synthase